MPMEQIVEFATNHWILVAAFVVISGLLGYSLLVSGSSGAIGPQAAVDLINRDEAIVLDVRPVADFSQGHILDAVNLPINGLKKQLGQMEKYQDRPIIVACRSGAQSGQACRDLQKAGFQKVYNLRGGILAWQSANLPVTRKH